MKFKLCKWIGNSPEETFPFLKKPRLTKLGRCLLPVHSLIRFRSMTFSKQQSGINLLPLIAVLLEQNVSGSYQFALFGPSRCCVKSCVHVG